MTRRAVVICGLLLLAVVLVRTAWVCDDAFITFRVIDNLLHGHGLRWNIAERVQVYTHPLWLLALVPFSAMIGPYYGSMLLGGALTLGLAGWLLARGAASTGAAVVALAALVGSQGFVDYGTSGLENPLAHALLVGVYWRLRSPSTPGGDTVTAGLAFLAAVNRLDHLVLVAPALAVLGARRPGAVALGALPLVAWEGFALLYYGFPFPNTAYAKLGAGLPAGALARQAWTYLRVSWMWDPVTGWVTLAGVGLALAGRRRADLAVAAAIGLWHAYLVRAGGDHMAGRFLTPTFVLALLVGIQRPIGPRTAGGLVAGLAVAGALAHTPPLTSGTNLIQNQLGAGDVADERAFFYRISGLLRRPIDPPLAEMPGCFEGVDERARGRHVVGREMIGWFSYFAGPDVHVVDPLGLGDPLLARIPATATGYRAGHYRRIVPHGYVENAQDGGVVRDPAVNAYFAELRLVTRGPLLSGERLRAMIALNRPGIDPRLEAWCAWSCSLWGEDAALALDPPVWIPPLGFAVLLAERREIRRVVLDADRGDYRVRLLVGADVVEELAITVGEKPGDLRFPSVAVDQVRIVTDPPGADRSVRTVLVTPRE